jgi:hypothetical protein
MSGNASTHDDSLAVVHSRQYLGLLVFAALLGVPISAAAYLFLWLNHHGRAWLFETMPEALGLDPAPLWWPVPLLAVASCAGIAWGVSACFRECCGSHVRPFSAPKFQVEWKMPVKRVSESSLIDFHS